MTLPRPIDGLLLVGLAALLAASAGLWGEPLELSDHCWLAALLGALVSAPEGRLRPTAATLLWSLLLGLAFSPLVTYLWSGARSALVIGVTALVCGLGAGLSARGLRSRPLAAGVALAIWSLGAAGALAGTGSLLFGLIAASAAGILLCVALLCAASRRFDALMPGPAAVLAAFSVVQLCVAGGAVFSSMPAALSGLLLGLPLLLGLFRE